MIHFIKKILFSILILNWGLGGEKRGYLMFLGYWVYIFTRKLLVFLILTRKPKEETTIFCLYALFQISNILFLIFLSINLFEVRKSFGFSKTIEKEFLESR